MFDGSLGHCCEGRWILYLSSGEGAQRRVLDLCATFLARITPVRSLFSFSLSLSILGLPYFARLCLETIACINQ